MDNFGTSKTVHTIVWPEIKEIILQTIQLTNYQSYKQVNKNRFKECVKKVYEWLMPVINLTDFNHVYPTTGTHSGLDLWLARETRPVYCLKGEYTYITAQNHRVKIVESIKDIPSNAVVYMSNPFSATGLFDQRYYDILENQVILDISYIGTTKPYSLTVTPNTESVFWSVSKAFGLGALRTGLEFHRHEKFLQKNLFDSAYFNVNGVDIIQACIGKFHVTEKYQIYQNQYHEICSRNNLSKSDTLLLATSLDKKWDLFKRENGINRLPIAKVLENLI